MLHPVQTKKSVEFKLLETTPKKNAIESDEILMQKALSVLNKPNDDLDIFGEFVASEMRQILDLSIRKIVKNEIIKTLLSYSDVMVTTTTTHVPTSHEEANTEYILLDESESALFLE